MRDRGEFMDIQTAGEIETILPEQAADFVAEMLGELAALSRQAGLERSSDLIKSAIPLLALESERHQSGSS
jgi:hypothetical protein